MAPQDAEAVGIGSGRRAFQFSVIKKVSFETFGALGRKCLVWAATRSNNNNNENALSGQRPVLILEPNENNRR